MSVRRRLFILIATHRWRSLRRGRRTRLGLRLCRSPRSFRRCIWLSLRRWNFRWRACRFRTRKEKNDSRNGRRQHQPIRPFRRSFRLGRDRGRGNPRCTLTRNRRAPLPFQAIADISNCPALSRIDLQAVLRNFAQWLRNRCRYLQRDWTGAIPSWQALRQHLDQRHPQLPDVASRGNLSRGHFWRSVTAHRARASAGFARRGQSVAR